MQAYDFSFDPFVTVTEKDTYQAGTNFVNSGGQTITVATGSTVEVKETRYPFLDFLSFFLLIIFFIWIVYKISCMIGD